MVPNVCDLGLSDITAELKEYGAEAELADFCLELYHALRNYKVFNI